MLNAHSRLGSFPEGACFVDIIGQYRGRTFGTRHLPLRSRVLYHLEGLRSALGFASPLGKARVKTFLKDAKGEEFFDLFASNSFRITPQLLSLMSIYDQLALKQGKDHWVEKSTNHGVYLDYLEKSACYEQGRPYGFIHLQRAGPENIASIYHAVKHYPHFDHYFSGSLDRCIDRWITATLASRRYAGKSGHHFVHYEDLIRSPESELQKLCEFMKLPFENQMLTEFSKTAQSLILKSEPWKFEVLAPLAQKGRSRFSESLTPSEQQRVLDRIREGGL